MGGPAVRQQALDLSIKAAAPGGVEPVIAAERSIEKASRSRPWTKVSENYVFGSF